MKESNHKTGDVFMYPVTKAEPEEVYVTSVRAMAQLTTFLTNTSTEHHVTSHGTQHVVMMYHTTVPLWDKTRSL